MLGVVGPQSLRACPPRGRCAALARPGASASRWPRMVVVCTALLAPAWGALAASAPQPSVRNAPEARKVIDWVLRHGDHHGRPFAVVDKRAARIYVLDGDGKLAGQSAALLGSAPGDHTVPGVGARTAAGTVALDDRTTPAGRFDAVPGRNLDGEHVVWADYASAFAIHRNRPGKARKARDFRLATLTPADNRVSYGCVVVPVAFYEKVIEPLLGSVRSVVYVLPEARPLETLFNAMQAQ